MHRYTSRISLAIGLTASAFVAACNPGNLQSTKTTLGVNCGPAGATITREENFTPLPGMEAPGDNGAPPAGYVLYGCYPLDPNNPASVTFCIWADPNNLGRPALARPAGTESPFWRIAPDRRLPDPNSDTWEGPKYSDGGGIQIDCITWAEVSSVLRTLQVTVLGSASDAADGDDPFNAIISVSLVAPGSFALAGSDLTEGAATVLLDGRPVESWTRVGAGQLVQVTGNVVDVAIVLSNSNMNTLSFEIKGKPYEIQSGGYWPFATIMKPNRRGELELDSFVVLDAGWTP